MARFGVEEEFVLLDRTSLAPLAVSPQVRERIVGERAGGRLTPEYLTCQFEGVTAPLADMTDAAVQLRGMRAFLAEEAAALDAIAAATGTPYIAPARVPLAPSPHYADVADLLGEITREHQANGLHIHVEIADEEQRVRTLNRAGAWLPALLAVTGNAPFVHGRDSGFASWRSILIRRLPTGWTPPRFADAADYHDRIAQLIDLGGIGEVSSLGWTARLSDRFPTVEVRVFDAQLTVDDTLLAVALTRALLLADGLPEAPGVGIDAIDASLWTAARMGTDARVIDPLSGEVAPAWQVVDGLLSHLGPLLDQHGDAALVADALGRIRADGTGSARQRRALAEGGVSGLGELYRAGTAG